jgi:hypothetical protein
LLLVCYILIRNIFRLRRIFRTVNIDDIRAELQNTMKVNIDNIRGELQNTMKINILILFALLAISMIGPAMLALVAPRYLGLSNVPHEISVPT